MESSFFSTSGMRTYDHQKTHTDALPLGPSWTTFDSGSAFVQVLVPLHGGEHPEGPASHLQRGQPQQGSNPLRRRPHPGRQVNEPTSLAADAEEVRLLLQVADPSQELRPQLRLHVRLPGASFLWRLVEKRLNEIAPTIGRLFCSKNRGIVLVCQSLIEGLMDGWSNAFKA